MLRKTKIFLTEDPPVAWGLLIAFFLSLTMFIFFDRSVYLVASVLSPVLFCVGAINHYDKKELHKWKSLYDKLLRETWKAQSEVATLKHEKATRPTF